MRVKSQSIRSNRKTPSGRGSSRRRGSQRTTRYVSPIETDLDIDTSIFWHDKWWTQCSSLPSSLYVTHFVKGGTSEKAAATTITLMFLYWYRFVLILRKECDLKKPPFPPEGDVRRPEAVLSEVAVGGVRGDAVPQRDVPRLGLPIPQQVD